MAKRVKDPSDGSTWIINDDGSATQESAPVQQPQINTTTRFNANPQMDSDGKTTVAAKDIDPNFSGTSFIPIPNFARPDVRASKSAELGQALAGGAVGLATGGASLPVQIGAGLAGQVAGRQAGSALGGDRESLEQSGIEAALGELFGLGMRGAARAGSEVTNLLDIAKDKKSISDTPNSLVRGLIKWYAPETQANVINPIGNEQVPFKDILTHLKERNIPLTTSQTTRSVRAAKTEGYNPDLPNIRQQQDLALSDMAEGDLLFDKAITKAEIGKKAQNLTRENYDILRDAAIADAKAVVGPLKGGGLVPKDLDTSRPLNQELRADVLNKLKIISPEAAARFEKSQANLEKAQSFSDFLMRRPPEKEVPFIINDSQKFKQFVDLNGKGAGADLLREDMLSEAFDRTTGTFNAGKARQYIHTHEKLDGKFTGTMNSEQRHGINKFIHSLEALGNKEEAEQLTRAAQLDSGGDGFRVAPSLALAPHSVVSVRQGSRAAEVLFQRKALGKLLGDTKFAYAAARMTELPKGSPALPSTLRTMLSIAGRMGVPLRTTDSQGDSYEVEFDKDGNVKTLEGER